MASGGCTFDPGGGVISSARENDEQAVKIRVKATSTMSRVLFIKIFNTEGSTERGPALGTKTIGFLQGIAALRAEAGGFFLAGAPSSGDQGFQVIVGLRGG